MESPNICTLVFEEERKRKKKDGTEENYIFKDRWYLSNVKNCLQRYLSLSMENATTVEGVLAEIERAEKNIELIKI